MNKTQYLQFSHRFNAPSNQVFDFFSQHENFGKIWPVRVTRVRSGFNPKNANGIGSARRISLGIAAIEETIVSIKHNQFIEYCISHNNPFKHYRGFMEFQAIDEHQCLFTHRFEITHIIPTPEWLSRLFIKHAVARGMTKAQTLIKEHQSESHQS